MANAVREGSFRPSYLQTGKSDQPEICKWVTKYSSWVVHCSGNGGSAATINTGPKQYPTFSAVT